ncbi:MAG: hypothetical protein A2Y86_02420, partial [Candidatus Aminicenantes bacterium RBG_13_62_12]
MKTPIAAFIIIVFLVLCAACGPTATVVSTGGPTIIEAQNVDSSAKHRIAVSRFEDKTAYLVSRGMTDMLVSALFRTGRFIVLERENLDVVLQEQRLSSAGAVSEKTAVPAGMLEGAEFLVIGAITEFEPDARGVKTSLGGAKQSHVALDLRIVDSATGRIVSSVTVEGQATDTALNAGALKYVGVSPLISGLKAWSNTP